MKKRTSIPRPDTTRREETARELAIRFARLADKKKAQDIVILNLKKLLFITDYFVICSGKNKKQIQAIADHIIEDAKTLSITPLGIEGYKQGSWILVDFGDVIVHLFQEQTREFYNLEFLWSDALRVRWKTSH